MRRKTLRLDRLTIRILASDELRAIGGIPDASIVYRCPTNTSDARSCFSECTSNTTFVPGA